MVDVYDRSVPRNRRGEPLIIGCEYLTTWRKNAPNKALWLLEGFDEKRCTLRSVTTTNVFETGTDTLIFRWTKKNRVRALMKLNGI